MRKTFVWIICCILFVSFQAAAQSNLQEKITVLPPNDEILASVRVDTLGVGSQTIAWGTKAGVFLQNADGTGKWLTTQNSPFKPDMFYAHAFFLGDYWVAVRNPAAGQGIFRFNGKTWTHYSYHKSLMLSNLVNCFLVDSKNRLWVGYQERGIDRFIGDKSPMMPFESIKAKHGLLPGSINTLVESGDYIWTGLDGGLCRFQLKDEPGANEDEESLNMKKWVFPDFPARTVFGLIPFNNKVAAATERGLVIPQGENWELLGVKDGIAVTPIKQIAFDGKRIWIGSSAGIQAYENGKFSPVITGLPTRAPSCIGAQGLPDGSAKIYVGTGKGARMLFVRP